jgi:hypothetical protein
MIINAKKICHVLGAAILFVCFSSFATTSPQFSKVNYFDQKLANKALISLHHAILEVNTKDKYLIATLTEQEKKLLLARGFTIEPAIEWTKEFSETFIDNKTLGFQNKNAIDETISGFSCYATVESTYDQAQSLAQAFPKLATWSDIGDSWMKVNQQSGYDIMVLKITNSELNNEKPILFVHSSMHAREYAPAALNLDFAKWLLNEYTSNAEAQWIVDNREVHLVFHMNPDGRKIAENQIFQRKNTNQNHCAGSTVGVDLNRNFAQTWGVTVDGSSGNECSEIYRGVSAESEPETQAVSNYIRSIFIDERGPNDSDPAPLNKSGLHIDLHSYGRLILWPYGHKEGGSPNNTGFVNLGNKLAWFNGYAPQQSIGLYPTDGTSDNVSYGELGVAAITFELGSSFFQNCAEYNNQILPDNLQALAYAAKVSEAPYLLSLGTDISTIKVNNSLLQTTVSQAEIVNLEVTSTTKQSALSNINHDVELFEYVIDGTFLNSENVAILDQSLEVDGNGGVKVIAQINTVDLSIGQHRLSVRAKNTEGQYGVPQSVFITISDNSAPEPSFTASCQNLLCTFDASQSIDSDGEIVKYQWRAAQNSANFEAIGDGQSLQHTFANAGTVTIELLIEDNNALQASTEQTITLTSIEVITVTPEKSNSSSSGAFSWFLLLFFPILITRLSKG